jgi:N-acetylglucosaminyldiphosphoundecaprenol N-acetyl-beta-D-mannosaminyltransferase
MTCHRQEAEAARPNRTNVLGVGVSRLTFQGAIQALEGIVHRRERGYVTVCTVHTVMECRRSPDLLKIVNESALVTPDGMPVVWLSRWGSRSPVEQVCGPELMPAMVERSSISGTRHFFYGGDNDVLTRLLARLRIRFPGALIVGSLAPPFGTAEDLATDEVAQFINQSRPDVVWVGLGTPKQEHWMQLMRDRLEAPLLIGVGAAFDFHSGRIRQAPRLIRRLGLEWAFRLAMDPRRLWRRYIFDNPAFIWLVAREKMGLDGGMFTRMSR